MYGGLGKVGLDYIGKKGQESFLKDSDEEDDADGKNPATNGNANGNEYVVPAFSAQAK